VIAVENSSEKNRTGTTNEPQQMENNSQNDAPDGVDNLEQNIIDPTSRYEELDESNASQR
jgi:hypothetical protein